MVFETLEYTDVQKRIPTATASQVICVHGKASQQGKISTSYPECEAHGSALFRTEETPSPESSQLTGRRSTSFCSGLD